MKDEITHKQDFAIFEHRFKQLQELKQDNETYKDLLKESLHNDFVAINETVLNRIDLKQYYTSNEILIELQQEYVKLLKEYNEYKNRSFWQKLFD